MSAMDDSHSARPGASASEPGGGVGRWSLHRARKRALLETKRRERRRGGFGEPDALRRAWWRVADASDLFWVRGAFWAMVAWLFLVGMSSLDYFGYQDVPVEDAEVVSIEISETVTVTCDRLGLYEEPAEIVTYRTLTPRQGYPDEFWEARCALGEEDVVGDVIRVLRTDVGPDYVLPHPIETAGQLWTWPWSIALVVGLGAGLLFFVQDEWYATTWAERWDRHNAPEPETVETVLARVAAKKATARRRAGL